MDEAAKIMSARVGLTAEEYKPLMKGTYILDLAEAKKRWAKAEGLDSVYGSSKIVDDFNVKNKVYKEADEGATSTSIPASAEEAIEVRRERSTSNEHASNALERATPRTLGRRPPRWLAVRTPLRRAREPCGRRAGLRGAARCSGAIISYVPFIWHPLVLVEDAGRYERRRAIRLRGGRAAGRPARCSRSATRSWPRARQAAGPG